MSAPSIRLVSFEVCPFVQRARVILNLKKIDYDVEYIDLSQKPDWFLDIVPTGKVPVLLYGEQVIFESNVITEFIDEISEQSLMPDDPVGRAVERAWIAFTDTLIMTQYRALSATSSAAAATELSNLFDGVERLCAALNGRPETIGMLEIAIAPVFFRIASVERFAKAFAKRFPADHPAAQWAAMILGAHAVKQSTSEAFPEQLADFFGSRGGQVFLDRAA